jgi:predicted DNA-binding transcriptional regulator AlpA
MVAGRSDKRVPTERQRIADAVWESDLTTAQKVVMLAFLKYAGEGVDKVWVTTPECARITGLSEATVKRAIRELVRLGWLVVVELPRPRRTGRYRLATPLTMSGDDEATPATTAGDGDRMSGELRSLSAATPLTVSDQPQTEPRTTTTNVGGPSTKPSPPLSIDYLYAPQALDQGTGTAGERGPWMDLESNDELQKRSDGRAAAVPDRPPSAQNFPRETPTDPVGVDAYPGVSPEQSLIRCERHQDVEWPWGTTDDPGCEDCAEWLSATILTAPLRRLQRTYDQETSA